MRSDAELDVNEDAEADQAEDKNEREVRFLPAHDWRLVESEIDQDKASNTSESAGQIELDPPLGFRARHDGWRRSFRVCWHDKQA